MATYKCPKCGATLKHIPAGVSKKTGKPYGEFWACPQCDYTFNPTQSKSGKMFAEIKAIRADVEDIKATLEVLRGDLEPVIKKLSEEL